jgi:hypothetical protein
VDSEPNGGKAQRDQLRARARAEGKTDIFIPTHPDENLTCGRGGCQTRATHGIILQDRPGMKPDTVLRACDEHDPDMRLIYSGLEPPPQ